MAPRIYENKREKGKQRLGGEETPTAATTLLSELRTDGLALASAGHIRVTVVQSLQMVTTTLQAVITSFPEITELSELYSNSEKYNLLQVPNWQISE